MALLSEVTLSVTQLNDYIKGLLGEDLLLSNLRLSGEISGFKRHSSGHLYFSVKDSGAAIRCVMFRQNALGLTFRPEDGARVAMRGYVSFFTRDGALQFYCESMKPDGVGALYLAFERLKERLRAEGLFDEGRKRALPLLPRRIALVTSPTGAAVRDMLRVAQRRHPGLDIVVVPAQVQGEGAAQSVAAALALAGRLPRVDAILCGRGGGSIEDLWCFNEEIVARAIADSPVPVVAGIGHETDFTIADFVADVRASTPSNAAEIAVPDVTSMVQRRDVAAVRLADGINRQLAHAAERLARAKGARVLADPQGLLAPAAERVDALSRRMRSALLPAIALYKSRVQASGQRLKALNPSAVLDRGYSIVLTEQGKAATSPEQIALGDKIKIKMAAGDIAARREG